MSSASRGAGSRIKRIPVKEPTRRDLHDLKEARESYDELLGRMIRRERDYRDWKAVVDIEKAGDFVAFDRGEIRRGDRGAGEREIHHPDREGPQGIFTPVRSGSASRHP